MNFQIFDLSNMFSLDVQMWDVFQILDHFSSKEPLFEWKVVLQGRALPFGRPCAKPPSPRNIFSEAWGRLKLSWEGPTAWEFQPCSTAYTVSLNTCHDWRLPHRKHFAMPKTVIACCFSQASVTLDTNQCYRLGG